MNPRLVRRGSSFTLAARPTIYRIPQYQPQSRGLKAFNPAPRSERTCQRMTLKYISQEEAQQIDEDLMSPSGAFSLDQLMELAGLACATAMNTAFPAERYRKAMIICGPGNQGGDGLVAARHMHMFGYKTQIYMPKQGKKDIYERLAKQCSNLHIPFIKSFEEFEHELKESDCVLDAIFGFSFHPPVRAPFADILRLLSSDPRPTLSVDIPSGWSVMDGPQPLKDEDGKDVDTLKPEALISLTAPKMGVRTFEGRHFLGGRFVPGDLAEKYGLNLPKYPGHEQVVELAKL